ncbi:phenylacetic acid degradation protein [Falsiroseomonas bella]|uniref:Phenylacetic acid degradation protein n=1 Tax=Falsiroseomonas bella TaxID=2184016 RepID=A0A317FIV4_9PROT|nr:2Fe-2S iron-sulfur cluster-binding protein [Falsiroseomonas bella]PWS38695.1 phenylacetic acid degradation protein [Falsiroseomonas bella]
MNAVTSTRFHPLRVLRVDRETADAIAVTLQPPLHAAELFRFTPGQYLTLRRVEDGEELRRSYSICAALDEGALRVGIKRVAGGRFSSWAVDHLKPGDVIEAMPPEGRFGMMPDPAAPPRTILGIACGSGITPVLSIAASVLAGEPNTRVVLLYGNRSGADIMFRTALEELKDRYLDRFAVVHVLSREKHELDSLHGRLDAARIQALLPGLVPPGAIAKAFLCGPTGLAEAATEALTALGLPHEHIHAEHFTPAPGSTPRQAPVVAPDAKPAAEADITIDGVTRRVPLAEGETVLEAGLRAGLDLPWSCRGGMCCTCRAKVTEGTVAMDTNYSLQPWELEAGFVLTCQSRPKTGHLVVDYDAA